jgi:hypothetical protein
MSSEIVSLISVVGAAIGFFGVFVELNEFNRKRKAKKELQLLMRQRNIQQLRQLLKKYNEARITHGDYSLEPDKIIIRINDIVLETTEGLESNSKAEVLEALNQPSKKGRENYLLRMVENSIRL